MHQTFRKSSTVPRVFALILAAFFSAGAAMAQQKATNIEPSGQPRTTGTVGTPGIAKTNLPASDSASRKATVEPAADASKPVTKSNDSAATSTAPSATKASSDYKKTLSNLAALYE